MDAVVEVGTAQVSTKATRAVVLANIALNAVVALSIISSPTSTTVPSISGHSISAVAPDHILEGGTLAHAA